MVVLGGSENRPDLVQLKYNYQWLTLSVLTGEVSRLHGFTITLTVCEWERVFSSCVLLRAERVRMGFVLTGSWVKLKHAQAQAVSKGHCLRASSHRLKGKVGKQADASPRRRRVEKMCGQASAHPCLSPCCQYSPTSVAALNWNKINGTQNSK